VRHNPIPKGKKKKKEREEPSHSIPEKEGIEECERRKKGNKN